jgi:hypothetical protein
VAVVLYLDRRGDKRREQSLQARLVPRRSSSAPPADRTLRRRSSCAAMRDRPRAGPFADDGVSVRLGCSLDAVGGGSLTLRGRSSKLPKQSNQLRRARGHMALGLKTVSGQTTELADEKLAEFRMTFRGRLLAPQDDGYEQARVVQNGLVDRRPGLIVQCSGTADVIDAVNLAREQQLLTAVRAGGHSIAGYGVCDDGLMLDLSAMHGVWVDPGARALCACRVGRPGGCRPRDASLRVGGSGWHCLHYRRRRADAGWGVGWLHRACGLACDNLRAMSRVAATATAFGGGVLHHRWDLPELQRPGGDRSSRARPVRLRGNLQRLTEVKKRYDPDNLFRLNNNIPPAQ